MLAEEAIVKLIPATILLAATILTSFGLAMCGSLHGVGGCSAERQLTDKANKVQIAFGGGIKATGRACLGLGRRRAKGA